MACWDLNGDLPVTYSITELLEEDILWICFCPALFSSNMGRPILIHLYQLIEISSKMT